MSVHCYLVRIRRYTKFDSLCFLVALAYLRRLCEQHGPSFCPTHHNIHRLFITAILVASKANDDVFHANIFMAQCGGITNAELNKLEIDLCERLQWGLTVEPDELIMLTSQLSDASSVLWAHWSTEVCERRWLRRAQEAAELAQLAGRISPCHGSSCVTPPPHEASFNACPQRHQRSVSLGSVSLGRMLSRKEQAAADAPPDATKQRSPDTSASPRSVLNRSLSFGGFLGSFTALVNLGS